MVKTKVGIVISDKMDKTIVVQINRMVPHKKYGKRYRVSKKLAVHDQNNQAKVGDTVTIQEGRPMSKTKSWVLVTTPEASPKVEK